MTDQPPERMVCRFVPATPDLLSAVPVPDSLIPGADSCLKPAVCLFRRPAPAMAGFIHGVLENRLWLVCGRFTRGL